MRLKLPFIAIAVALNTVAPFTSAADIPYFDPVEYSMKPDASLLPGEAKDAAAIAHHQVKLANQTILNYTATTGHLVTEGDKKATVFYAAYTAKEQSVSTRPVTFIFNGGPGSPATVLHIMGWGPMKMGTNTGTPENPQYDITQSPYTLLDQTDLVFIDPPGNGYSQAVFPAKNKDFKSLDDDTSVFRDFIIKYLKVNHRESSPKYLYGESAGGPRAIYLAKKLNEAGFPFDGAVLNSPMVGRYDTCDSYTPGQVNSCAGFIPTVAALSHYYGLAGKGKPFDDFMFDVMSFVEKEYLPQELKAINDGIGLPDETVNKLTEITGFNQGLLGSFPYERILSWQHNLRDAYISLLNLHGCDESPGAGVFIPSYCPSWDMYDMRKQKDMPYDLFNMNPNGYAEDYFKEHLGYESKVRYACHDDDCKKDVENLSITRPGDEGTWVGDTVPVLIHTMEKNKKLKILVITGYSDHRTPFAAARLAYTDPKLDQKRIKTRVFEGGHMTYWTASSLPKIKQTLNQFYTNSPTVITTKVNRLVLAQHHPVTEKELLQRLSAETGDGTYITTNLTPEMFWTTGKKEVKLSAGDTNKSIELEIISAIPPVN